MVDEDTVDQVALAIRSDEPPGAIDFVRAWEAWGVWANGGFEAVFTGALADEHGEILAALRSVGAEDHASLFARAASVYPDGRVPDHEARLRSCEAHLSEWQTLDGEMAALEPVKVRLGDVLDNRPDLRALAD